MFSFIKNFLYHAIKKVHLWGKKARLHSLITLTAEIILFFCLLFVFALIFVPERISINGLNTFHDIESYAQNMPELPSMDNTNMVRPDYDSFYRANNPNYLVRKWRSLAAYLHLSSTFTWSSSYFKSLIELTLTRFKGYKVEKNVMYKIAPTAQAQLVIIGDLSGAYHSLVRDMQQLFKLKILDDSLKIIAPNTYIVFMGDAISRSPYGMETLGILLRLLEMNPDTVIYMRGNHEDNKYWEAFGLKDQLDIRLGFDNSGPVIDAINAIFTKLPLGLYVAIPNEPHHFVRISHLSSTESSKLNEDNYAHFLEAKQLGVLDRYEIDKTVMHNSAVTVDAAINSEKKRQTFQVSSGLRQLPADGGVITWTLLSAPTLVNQKGLKFVDDAFVIIQLAEQKEDWKITLYSQNAVKKDGFVTSEYQFFTGMNYAEKRHIKIEQKVPVKVGHKASIEKENKKDDIKVGKKESNETVQKQEQSSVFGNQGVLSPEQLKTAIRSRFIQQLVTPRHKKYLEQKKEQQSVRVDGRSTSYQQVPQARIGTQTFTIPLTVTITDQSPVIKKNKNSGVVIPLGNAETYTQRATDVKHTKNVTISDIPDTTIIS